jgi:hypothetical protein
MRRLLPALTLLLLAAASSLPAPGAGDLKAFTPRSDGAVSSRSDGIPAGEGGHAAYRLECQIRGGAISRVLLLFPLRVYYDASVAVDLAASRRADGSTRFVFSGLPRPAYILRTLGFGGKTLALLTAGGDESRGDSFTEALETQWRKRAPEFAARAKTVKRFPHRLLATRPQPFSFERDAAGAYRDFVIGLEPRYIHYPAKTGIYFNVFPLLAEMLKLLNHRFVPANAGHASYAQLPAEWGGDALDFSVDLNRTAGLLEKAVKSLVTVEQKSPFRLHFRGTSSRDGEIEICGEGFPDVPLWKGFMIREVFRRVRLSPFDGELLSDEIWLGIRNNKGQGGFGRLRLDRINSREDTQ